MIHPAIAKFRLGADVTLARFGGGRALQTTRWGFNANVNLLPRGSYPISFHGGRSQFDYSGLTQEDPLLFMGVPDTQVRAGARLRLRAGPLRGSHFGVDWSSLSYQKVSGKTTSDEQWADWDGTGQGFQRHFHLARHAQSYGILDYRMTDYQGNFDQRGNLGSAWRWNLALVAQRRDAASQATSSSATGLSLGQNFIRPMRGRDTLDLRYEGGYSGSGAASFHSHSLVGRYLWRPSEPWSVTPFLGYSFQKASGPQLHAPNLGVAASWTGQVGTMTLGLRSSATYLLLFRTGGQGNDSAIGGELGATAGHGDESTLRSELDLGYAFNRLRNAGDLVTQMPDLGASLGGTGTENSLAARLTLRRRWRFLGFHLYSEANRRELSQELTGTAAQVERRATVDGLQGTLQMSGPGITLSGGAGLAVTKATPRQEIRYWAAGLNWRPFSLFSLSGSYRADRRDTSVGPSVDGQRFETEARLQVGAFVLTGQLFETREKSVDLPERANRGFLVSLSRNFGGWLPFVTGALPRSAIR